MKLRKEVVIRKMANKYIVVAVGRSHDISRDILKLNEDAASIIFLLQKEITEEEIIKKSLKQYKVTKKEEIEQTTNSIKSFIEMLREKNLIQE